MLKRLVAGKSQFSVTKWEKQHKTRQRLLQNFGIYPYVMNQSGTTELVDNCVSAWQSSTKIEYGEKAEPYFPMTRSTTQVGDSIHFKTVQSGGFASLGQLQGQRNVPVSSVAKAIDASVNDGLKTSIHKIKR